MIHLLADSQYPLVRPFFHPPQLALVMAGVLAGNSPARIWVDDPVQPSAALMWDKAHCLYWLTAAATSPSTVAAFHNLFTQTLLPEAVSRGIRVVKVYDNGPDAAAAIPTLFAPLALESRARSLYTFADPVAAAPAAPLPAGFHLQPIDRPLLEERGLENAAALRAEVESCWTSRDAFYNNGFGFCLVQGQTIVGWCTAEYVSAGQCGTGIETIEAYQQRGLATATAHAFVGHCLSLALVPHWDAWQTNLPSIRVAEKVGFRHMLDYTVQLGFVP